VQRRLGAPARNSRNALAPRRERPIKNAFASSGFAPSLEIRKGSGIGCDNVSYPKSCHFFKMNGSDY
jgi:hypothetical protein